MIFIYQTFGGLAPEAQRYATPEVKKSGWTIIKEYVYIYIYIYEVKDNELLLKRKKKKKNLT